MHRVVEQRALAPGIREYVILAPDVARTAAPGQFVVIRLREEGERIPLTIVETDPVVGTIVLIVQDVGKTTHEMAGIDADGGVLSDVAGPLGNPTEIDRFGKVVCVGGGLGIAPLYPIAKALAAAGNHTIGILGARSREFLFYVDRFRDVLDETILTTDDGSLGRKGTTSDALRDVLRSNAPVDRVWLIGPPIMMKVGAETTRPFGVTTLASLNPLMLDGTGMCGGCRVDVGGRIRFACVDGPEFDAQQVDFDRLISRLRYYRSEEAASLERFCARSRISRGTNTR